ncbi:MAG: aminoglycoside phosphotransferase family protein [Candidatus Thorarchaeota archaeon]|jgi:aminoglycoside phosphotransferase (APT) family kinase protein
MKKLCELVNNSVQSLDNITIEATFLGGWSNVNLLVIANDNRYVLKLPGLQVKYEVNPFEYEYHICNHLARNEIAPRPIEIGRLNDSTFTPFLILEYIEGKIPANPAEITQEDQRALDETLSIMSNMAPPKVRAFNLPSEYLTHLWMPVKKLLGETLRIPESVSDVLKRLSESRVLMLDSIDNVCPWSKKLIHGDLQETNIVVMDGSVRLLDLESCCIGEPSYDIVYLYTQHTTSTLSDYPAVRNHLDLDQVQIDSLESLALISVLSWSIERLLNITLGRVEHYLVDTGIHERILKYVKSKSARLNELLNAL